MSILNKFCFAGFLFLITVTGFAFSGGQGTIEDPYLISDCQGLQSIIGFPSAHFKLMNDINCAAFDYGDGKGFMPIGSVQYPFVGILDGDYYVISNLNINRPNQDQVGLLGYIALEAAVKNLAIKNSIVIGGNNTGGLVGYATSATGLGEISDVSFEGKVSGNMYVGGLVGHTSYKNIVNSDTIADVTTATDYAGGLVGQIYHAVIQNSSATGVVKSSSETGQNIGGVTGYISGSYPIFEKNFASCIVTGHSRVGGLIGYTTFTHIKDSYAQGEVHAKAYSGGLIGYIAMGEVLNSYSANAVYGNEYTGGLIGDNTSTTIENSYWDTIVSGQLYSAGGTPKTTTEMYQQVTYVNWDFNNTWYIEENITYPRIIED